MPDEDISSVLDMPKHKCLACLLPGAAAVKQKHLPIWELRHQQADCCIGAGHGDALHRNLLAATRQHQHIYQELQ